ncbi:hypothetical protein H7X46_18265 [Pseudonocardia sp. C8]|uniref:hypothetical protein n=1 Tax=Pseudonocardia sp. C8 TaxID=2762759 RepID=UPI0016435BA4|nr:hypothetical protein [Pseudonocardia sp. C8]MBC3193007.1 hypothetical protein [Pseudonocardia sp. C8]
MTTYAHDPAASTIVASWPTGDGAVAHRVARVPRNWDGELARRTAGVLTRLSTHLWCAYAELEVDEIRPFRIVEAVRYPKLPIGEQPPTIMGEDDRVEAARLLGSIVSRAPGRAFRDAVVQDVRAEIDAVLAADGGDLAGRARQALAHVRPVVPDDQLAAAHALLHDEPLAPWALLTAVEPTVAAVAVLRWLRAAATLTAAVVGHTTSDVVALAEAIGHEDLTVTRQVLEMTSTADDDEVVRLVLQEAVLAGRGQFVVCPDRAEPIDSGDGDDHSHQVVTTVLDPAEPGRCLVDGLIRGLQGCFRVYADEVGTRDHPDADAQWPEAGRAAELRRRFSDELRKVLRSAR